MSGNDLVKSTITVESTKEHNKQNVKCIHDKSSAPRLDCFREASA